MFAWLLAFMLCLPSGKAEAAHPIHGEIKSLTAELRLESRKTGARNFAAIEEKARLLEEKSRAVPEGPDRTAAQALIGKFRQLMERAKQGEALEEEGQEGPYVVPPPVPGDSPGRERLDRLKDQAGLAGDAARGAGVFDGKKGGPGGAVAVAGPGEGRQTEQIGRYVRRHKSKDGTLLGHDLDLTNLLFPDHPSRSVWASAAAAEMLAALAMADPGGKKAKLLAAWILRTLDASNRFSAGETWRLYFTTKGKVHFVRVVGGAEIMDPEGTAVEDVLRAPSAPASGSKPIKLGGKPKGKAAKGGGGGGSGSGKGGKGGGGRRGRGGGGKGGGGGGGRGGSGSGRGARGAGGSNGGRPSGARGRQGNSDFGGSSSGGRPFQRPQSGRTAMSRKASRSGVGGKRGGGSDFAKAGSAAKPGKGKLGAAGSAGKGAKADRGGGVRGFGKADGTFGGGRWGGRRLGKSKGGAGGAMAMKGTKPAPAGGAVAAAAEPRGPAGAASASPRDEIVFTDAVSAKGAVEEGFRDAVASPPPGPAPVPVVAPSQNGGGKQWPMPATPSVPAVGWGFMVGFATGAFRIVRMFKWVRRGFNAVSALSETTETVT